MEYAVCLCMEMQIMTAFAFPAIAFQTETICATNCLHSSNNRKPISANTFPSPNATVGFGCFKRQRGEKKKLDWQWPDLNIVLSGCSQHLLRGYIFPSEIIASVLLWMFFRREHRAVWSSWTWVICSKGGPHFGKLFLGRCTIIANMSTVHIVSYLKEALMLIGPKFSCWCSSEISPVMKEKKDPNRRQNHQFYARLSKRVSRSRLPDSQVGSKCSY